MAQKRAEYDKAGRGPGARGGVRIGPRAGVRGAAVLVLTAAAAGCSVGQGAPDGWRYQRHGPVAVALPKTWRATADGALLRGPGGRADAGLSLTATTATPSAAGLAGSAGPAGPAGSAAAAPRAAGSAPGVASGAAGSPPVPAGARRQTLTLDGRPARVAYFARPAPDGRPADHVEVRVEAPGGTPLTLRAWTARAATHDRTLLAEIVNSIEFPRGGTP
ncbi:hypothetical protein VSR01_25635 [Actinacidiphila sp. DG2A-62]|uniref:hypothetical protein n=1 Tax=Actinacidiphila sp. DG2A-62 TaxID=3108821 RepID=UPI002DBA05CD|nr:hypothetical protein [Actinacidiphila sp. DG2A-62]MEC3996704.1 hypothetical protein [Actinacidiphila sp. DG2A-62]